MIGIPLFITFEGPEGSGKSTLLRGMASRLEQKNIALIQTKEPGGTPVGERIREVVLLEPDLEIEPLTEFLLYSASRAQIVRKVIKPALGAGQWVLCDRYMDSSLAYQGYGRGLDARILEEISYEATQGLKPHLTFLLDIDPEEGLERVALRGQKDRLERADLDFHRRVRAGFLQLAHYSPERFYILDARKTPLELLEESWGVLKATVGID
jgi:dTMP kinase